MLRWCICMSFGASSVTLWWNANVSYCSLIMTNHLSTGLDCVQHLINNSNGGVMRRWFRHRRVFLKIHHSLCFSPRRPTTKLWNIQYYIQIHLCVLELSQHSHRKILLHAVSLWTDRFGNTSSHALLWNQGWDGLSSFFLSFLSARIFVWKQHSRHAVYLCWTESLHKVHAGGASQSCWRSGPVGAHGTRYTCRRWWQRATHPQYQSRTIHSMLTNHGYLRDSR